MTKCPYCGGKLNTSRELPPLTPKEFKIFNTILENGRSYTKPSKIIEGSPEVSIRVVVSNINKKLKKFRMTIVNYRGVGYRLEEL